MEQLPLEVRLADHALFDTFYEGPNGEPAHALRALLESEVFASLWLCGPADTGKTHLLQAAVNAADAGDFRSAYVPLKAGFELSPGVLEGMDELDLVCIDDVDSIAGVDAWEQGLFSLFENLRQRRGRLVLAAERSPVHCGFALPDLTSRFSSGATFRLTQLGDEDKLKAMQLRADWRGLVLPDDSARYLISRVGRGCSQLFSLLDQLDREALTAQKKLTIPFVKSVLNQ
jgi:DnaA family protein